MIYGAEAHPAFDPVLDPIRAATLPSATRVVETCMNAFDENLWRSLFDEACAKELLCLREFGKVRSRFP